MIFSAPHPNIQNTIVVPEPILNNQEQLLSERDYRIMMNKTVYSYVKRLSDSKFSYSFRLTRPKSIEVIAFVEAYIGLLWRIVDHHENEILAYCTSDPKTLTAVRGVGGSCVIDNYSMNEGLTLDLEFEGEMV